jgi:uncharacterized protein
MEPRPAPPFFSSFSSQWPFHVMTKPIGPLCNLDCKYCFYLEKEKLYPESAGAGFRMSDAVLERYISGYIASQPPSLTEISFAWQGGEPTLMGVEFFRRVVELQKQYCPYGKTISNALQTNGTLLDDEWCRFLYQHNFLVGLSIDGPRELHDFYRVDKGGKPTFDKVMRGLELLKKHRVEFNTLTVVNRRNSRQPLEVYRFLKSVGSPFMQFIPLVERVGEGSLAGPGEVSTGVTEWSVEPLAYGTFLCSIFDEWIRRDVGRVFVQIFEAQLGRWMGRGSTLCVFSETCGDALAMEHNGDVYSCDHYVYPRFKLGNVMNDNLRDVVNSPLQLKFGADKRDTLPQYCRDCRVRFACNGECPKHRFLQTPDGEEGLNYLCAGYKKFFTHIDPYFRAVAPQLEKLIAANRFDEVPAAFRSAIAQVEGKAAPRLEGRAIGRNEACPCGSGCKYKKCCGALNT